MGILRLLLALAVVIEHSYTSQLHGVVVHGIIAVQAFFIVSGFYMAMVLNEKYNFPGATRIFYWQRYLRLAPMYWVAIVCVLAASGAYSWLGHQPRGKFTTLAEYGGQLSPGAIVGLTVPQLTMIGMDVLEFCKLVGQPLGLHFTATPEIGGVPAHRFLLVGQAWSLSVELLFYLVAPFIVRRSVRVQLLLVAATFVLRIISAHFYGLAFPWGAGVFPIEAGLFLIGSVGYRCLAAAEELVKKRRAVRLELTLLLGGFIFFYYKIPLPDEVRRWAFLAVVALAVPVLFAATRRAATDRWIGETSYPLYLLHGVAAFLAAPIYAHLQGIQNEMARLLCPLAVAVGAYFILERPFEAWRAKVFKRQLQKTG